MTNRLKEDTRAAVLNAMLEGTSVNGITRMLGPSKVTIGKLLLEVGDFCQLYQEEVLRNVTSRRVEIDEMWSFVQKRRRSVNEEGHGHAWTYIALCVDSKMVFCWLTGDRSPDNTFAFMREVARRVVNRLHLSSDGNASYRSAVASAFGHDGVDYGMVVKTFDTSSRHHDAPPAFTGIQKQAVMGRPNLDYVTTNHVERLNLTMRQQVQRLARRTAAHSKSLRHHKAAIALAFMNYNFIRRHSALRGAGGDRMTPAMAAGFATRPWTLQDILYAVSPCVLIGEDCRESRRHVVFPSVPTPAVAKVVPASAPQLIVDMVPQPTPKRRCHSCEGVTSIDPCHLCAVPWSKTVAA